MYFSDDFLNNILNCCFLQQFHGPPTFDSKLLTVTVLSFYQPQSGMVMQNCMSKKRKGNVWILVDCSFIICLVLNFFANHDNFLKF